MSESQLYESVCVSFILVISFYLVLSVIEGVVIKYPTIILN